MARALQVFAANLAETERIAAALRLEEENARKAEAARLAAAAEAAEAQARLHEQVHVVGTLAGALEALSQRDLTFALEEELPGDYDQLRRNFNGAVGQLSHALAAIEAEASAKLVASVHVFTFRHKEDERADRLAAEWRRLRVPCGTATGSCRCGRGRRG